MEFDTSVFESVGWWLGALRACLICGGFPQRNGYSWHRQRQSPWWDLAFWRNSDPDPASLSESHGYPTSVP
jgi:hypothetical protein